MTSLIHHLMPTLSSVSPEPLMANITQHQGVSLQQFCPLKETNKSMLKTHQSMKWSKTTYKAGSGIRMEQDELLCL